MKRKPRIKVVVVDIVEADNITREATQTRQVKQ